MVLSSFFIAIIIVLNKQFSYIIPLYGINFIRIGLGGSVTILASCLLGPFYGGIIGLFSDIIGAVLFPQGPFNPGYSFDAMMIGIIPGLVFLSYKYSSFIRNHISMIANTIVSLIAIALAFFIISTSEFKLSNKSIIELNLTTKLVFLSIDFVIAAVCISSSLIFKKRKKEPFIAILLAFLLCELLITIPLSPLWSAIQASTPYNAFFLPKAFVTIIQMPFKVYLIYLVYRGLSSYLFINLNTEEQHSTKVDEI
jgi:ECF transporter S component (folate family)